MRLIGPQIPAHWLVASEWQKKQLSLRTASPRSLPQEAVGFLVNLCRRRYNIDCCYCHVGASRRDEYGMIRLGTANSLSSTPLRMYLPCTSGRLDTRCQILSFSTAGKRKMISNHLRWPVVSNRQFTRQSKIDLGCNCPGRSLVETSIMISPLWTMLNSEPFML